MSSVFGRAKVRIRLTNSNPAGKIIGSKSHQPAKNRRFEARLVTDSRGSYYLLKTEFINFYIHNNILNLTNQRNMPLI